MRMLLAEDDLIPRTILADTLTEWGYEVVAVDDGNEALRCLEAADAPPLALLDWMMPGHDGVDVCRKVRQRPTATPPYLILLTGRDSEDDLVTGLQCGANDYVTKPFSRRELHARIQVGFQVVGLQRGLAARVTELESALAQVQQLQELLPICGYCKKIRGDQNYWHQIDAYLSRHADLHFSHGVCPECADREMQRYLQNRARNETALSSRL